jgi:hypothetical protein
VERVPGRKDPNRPVIKANSREPAKALMKFVTSKPGTTDAARAKSNALSTKENKPNVRRFKGKDSKERIGRTKKLINPITKAAIMAVPKELIAIPGKRASTTNKTKAVRTQCNNSEIMAITFQF